MKTQPHPYLVDATGAPLQLRVPEPCEACMRCATRTAQGMEPRGFLGQVITQDKPGTRVKWQCTRCDYEEWRPTSTSSTPSNA